MSDAITVTVSAKALCEVLVALHGPPHYIRELQATMSLDGLVGDRNPISLLTEQFNEQVTKDST